MASDSLNPKTIGFKNAGDDARRTAHAAQAGLYASSVALMGIQSINDRAFECDHGKPLAGPCTACSVTAAVRKGLS